MITTPPPPASWFIHQLLLALAILSVLVQAGTLLAAPPDAVEQSMDKAKAYLLAQQHDGNWEESPAYIKPVKVAFDTTGSQWTGMTALTAYALLESGESVSEPQIASAIKFLVGQQTTGTYALATRCLLWSVIRLDETTRPVASRDLRQLLINLQLSGPGAGFTSYGATPAYPGEYDHSTSQFAVLGAWELARNGFEVPANYWLRVDRAWRGHQISDGSWAYALNSPNQEQAKHTVAMTAGGAATLSITDEMLHEGAQCRGNATDPAEEAAIKWLAQNFDWFNQLDKIMTAQPRQTYALFAVSRVGEASGRKFFGDVDWYQRMSDYLVGAQAPDGSWIRTQETPFIAATSLGLLALAYGSSPVVMQKLEYELTVNNKPVEGHWNQRPQDVRHLSTWLGRQLESRLNWGIVRPSSPLADLLDAPILYISGDQALTLSQADRDNLKQFVEYGGLIVGNADERNARFVDGFKKLGQAMFPDYEFRALPKDHPIFVDELFPSSSWKAKTGVLGMSNGVRELMLLPEVDLSRIFQLKVSNGSTDLYQLAEDIVLYATDQKRLPRRGNSYLVHDNGTPATRTIKIARLQYPFNWNPEPGGWRQFAASVRNTDQIDLTVNPIPLGEGRLASYKLAHLTGTSTFQLTESQRTDIRDFAKAGGTLIVDAAGGSAAFATSAERELGLIFGEAAVKELAVPLPPEHPLYAAGGANQLPFKYRRHARAVVGKLAAPRVSAVTVDGRIVCFYSRDDLSAGLVGNACDGIVGYEPQTATMIMRKMILFAGN